MKYLNYIMATLCPTLMSTFLNVTCSLKPYVDALYSSYEQHK